MAFVRSDFPDLVSRNVHKWSLESYKRTPVVYPEVCRIASPAEFNVGAMDEYVQVGYGVGTGPLKERRPLDAMDYDMGFEDYKRLGRKRQYYNAAMLPKELIDTANELRMINFLQELSQRWGEELAHIKDKLAADHFLEGSLTAGHAPTFDDSVGGIIDDPYPKVIYDNLPWFDTAHPLSKAVSTTKANHTASSAFSYSNLQSAWTAMTDTAAYDARGNRIDIRPSVLLHGPSLEFSVRNVLESVGQPGTGNNDANTVRQLGLRPVMWRRISGSNSGSVSVASGWFLVEPGDLVVIDEWQPTEVRTWFDEEHKAWKISFQAWFGFLVMDWRHTYCCNVAAA